VWKRPHDFFDMANDWKEWQRRPKKALSYPD
jgi:hypothetical protein